MQLLKDLLRNLILLAVLVLILFALMPTTMSQLFDVYGKLFGPVALLFVIVIALPRKRRRY